HPNPHPTLATVDGDTPSGAPACAPGSRDTARSCCDLPCGWRLGGFRTAFPETAHRAGLPAATGPDRLVYGTRRHHIRDRRACAKTWRGATRLGGCRLPHLLRGVL